MPYYWKIGGDTYHWYRNCHLVPNDVKTNPEWKVSETKPNGKKQCKFCKNRNKFLFLGAFAITIIFGIAIDQYFDFKMQTLFDVSSTIIQALITLIAFLAFLYVYRTKRIRDLKDDQGYWLAQVRKGRVAEKGYSEPLSKEQEKEIENEVLRNPIYREKFKLYLKKKNKIEAINYPFKISVLLALFVIIVSLLILPFGSSSPPKNPISWFPWVSVSVTFEIVFTIIIIIFTAWFVKKVI